MQFLLTIYYSILHLNRLELWKLWKLWVFLKNASSLMEVRRASFLVLESIYVVSSSVISAMCKC